MGFQPQTQYDRESVKVPVNRDCLTIEEYYQLGIDKQRPTCSPVMSRHAPSLSENGGMVWTGLAISTFDHGGRVVD
jgi:hypothetical protein